MLYGLIREMWVSRNTSVVIRRRLSRIYRKTGFSSGYKKKAFCFIVSSERRECTLNPFYPGRPLENPWAKNINCAKFILTLLCNRAKWHVSQCIATLREDIQAVQIALAGMLWNRGPNTIYGRTFWEMVQLSRLCLDIGNISKTKCLSLSN